VSDYFSGSAKTNGVTNGFGNDNDDAWEEDNKENSSGFGGGTYSLSLSLITQAFRCPNLGATLPVFLIALIWGHLRVVF
jgi:hypothetical protein